MKYSLIALSEIFDYELIPKFNITSLNPDSE